MTFIRTAVLSGNALALGLALALICTPDARAADTLKKIREMGSITLSYRDALIPFSYVNNGKPIGYAIDICVKLAEAVKRELGLPQLQVKYLPVTSANRMSAVVNGKADLECGTTTNNAERRQQVQFTIPHFVASARMLTLSGFGIRDWPDLRDKSVVITKGTTTLDLVKERSRIRSLNLKLIEAADHAAAFRLVAEGKADAFAMDDVVLYGLRAGVIDPEQFAVVGAPLSAEPYAIMLPKDDAAFKAVIDREMARIIQDGEIYKLYDKWFKSSIPPDGMNLNMPMSHILRGIFQYPTDKIYDFKMGVK